MNCEGGGMAHEPAAVSTDSGKVAAVRAYHEHSKHRPDRYAPGPGRLDWANQPDPWRHWNGAARALLPLAADGLATRYAALRRGELPPPAPFDLAHLGILFELSLALSAWKEFGGARWALRCNPSSGNLHPTEGYLIAPALPGIPGGVHHYLSREHVLEQRAAPREGWDAAFGGQGVLVALSSIHWREAWKYGERGYRYCLLDAGHAIAAVSLAAAALGWRQRLVEAWRDADVARLLATDRQEGPEAERPEALLALWPAGEGWPAERERAAAPPATALRALAAMEVAGRPNRLGGAHRPWHAAEEAARAAERREPPPPAFWHARAPEPRPPSSDRALPASALARRRRTALAFDGETPLPRDALFRMLLATLPEASPGLFGAFPWRPAVHLVLLVHRVAGLAPGLYVLPRDPAALPELRAALGAASRWSPVEGAPRALPLHHLVAGDLRDVARAASCDQDVARDGAFTAALLARFEPPLREHGAWMYRRLHWEAGAVGHALYLEAEAAGVRGTGMGCFLDDELHALVGLADRRFQSLYHFAAGRPVEDRRLRTAEPYAHLPPVR